MKALIITTRLLLLACITTALHAQEKPPETDTEAATNIPAVIQEGFVKYQDKGYNSAVSHWKANFFPGRSSDDFARNLRDKINKLDDGIGKLVKVEMISEMMLTRSLRTYYFLLGFEEGALFMRMDVYAAPKGLGIIFADVNVNMDKILPRNALIPTQQ